MFICYEINHIEMDDEILTKEFERYMKITFKFNLIFDKYITKISSKYYRLKLFSFVLSRINYQRCYCTHSITKDQDIWYYKYKKNDDFDLNSFMFDWWMMIIIIIKMNKCLSQNYRIKKTRCNFQNKHTRSTSGKSSIFFCNSSPMSCASFNGIFSGKTISISTKYDVPKWNARTVSIFVINDEWWYVNH